MLRSWWLALALLLGACGGNVVIDKDAQNAGGDAGSAGAAGDAGGAAGNAGIGGAAGTSSGPGGSANIACSSFCTEAAEMGCPKTESCQGWCENLFQETCTDELIAVLDCAPPLLTSECHLGYPNGDNTCVDRMDALQSCAFSNPKLNCQSVEATLEGGGGCIGLAECGAGSLTMICSSDGDCDCLLNDIFAGSCQNIIGGLDLCVPMLGCCSAILPI
jgi:hypothetical protein